MKLEKKISPRAELRDPAHGKIELSWEIIGLGSLYLICLIFGTLAWVSI